MPPKAKYTREQIIDAALEITREKGIDAVTARDLGARLGVSARPIFTAFENMGEVHAAVRTKAHSIYESYLSDYKDYDPPFKRHGMQTIAFAQNEPKLFSLLFMQPDVGKQNFKQALTEIMGSFDDVLNLLEDNFKLNHAQAERLFDHMWIHTYGISSLCALGVCVFSESEVSNILSEAFIGIITAIKSDNLDQYLKMAELKKKE